MSNAFVMLPSSRPFASPFSSPLNRGSVLSVIARSETTGYRMRDGNENNRVSENKGNEFPLSNGRLLREANSMRII